MKFARVALAGVLLSGVHTAEAQGVPRPDLSGIWSTTVTHIQHPGWSIEELFDCNCTPESHEYLRDLLYDPANDHMSAQDIQSAVKEFNDEAIAALFTETARQYAAVYDPADDPSIQCEPFGAIRTILHNDPIAFEQYEDRIVIRGEDMTSDRTVFMDGRPNPAQGEKSLTGHSIGRYEGSALVIETTDLTANIAEDNLSIHHSDQARGVERYTLSDDGTKLKMTFTLIDPVMYREPLTLEQTRILTPDARIIDAPCESISGQP